jgi:hypothetical protein
MPNERDTEFTTTPGVRDVGGESRPGSTTDFGGRTGYETGGTASGTQTGSSVRDLATEARQKAVEQVQTQAEDRKDQAANSLGSVAQSLRTASQQLNEQEGVARYMERAANQVDNLASFLNSHDVADMMDELEHFARRQPAVFVGGAFALGVLGARFLKSSRRNLDYRGPTGSWSNEDLTSRVDDPTRDSISRPMAPGYAPPEQRGDYSGLAPDTEPRSRAPDRGFDEPDTGFSPQRGGVPGQRGDLGGDRTSSY